MSDRGFPFSAGTAGGAADQSGAAAGSQAQFNNLLVQITKIASILAQGGIPSSLFYVNPWTAAGNIVLSTAYPGVKSGLVSVRKAVAAATTVTLDMPGPWVIADGNGGAAANNITVQGTGGQTVNGAATFVMATNWEAKYFVLDGANWLAF